MGEFIAVNEDEESQAEATWLQPRRVRIGRGWGWLYGGFGLFNRGMGVSVGICHPIEFVGVIDTRSMCILQAEKVDHTLKV